MRRKEMKEKGVSLIALVVIIIILLILAGITIATLTGDNSIVKNANKAEDASKVSQIEKLVKEEAVHTYNKRGEFDSEQFKDNVRKHLGQYNPEIKEDEDTITVTIDGVDVVIDKETGDIYLVADVLGHKDVNTTKKHCGQQNEARQHAPGGL